MTRRLSLLTGFFILSACGGSADVASYSVTVRFARNAVTQACAETPEVDKLRIRALSGGLAVAGFPLELPCDDTPINLPLEAGSYELIIQALGPLGADTEAVVYSAETDVVFPRDDGAEIALESRVAYLTLDWVFGSEGLAPCGIDVTNIRVFVSAGGSNAASFSGNFACADGPIKVESPFDLTNYNIRLEAVSVDGFTLYRHESSRLFTAGENEITVPLEPSGGRLLVNWDFAVAADSFAACDAGPVGVSVVSARITGLEGGGEVVDRTLDCDLPRPAALPGLRFSQGRQLRLELSADGNETFYGATEFVMPDGDYRDAFLELEAVGTATIALQVQTATCTSTEITKVRTTLQRTEPTGGGEPRTLEIATPSSRALLEQLPYGRWRVELVQETLRGTDLCSLVDERTVDGADNQWAPFVF